MNSSSAEYDPNRYVALVKRLTNSAATKKVSTMNSAHHEETISSVTPSFGCTTTMVPTEAASSDSVPIASIDTDRIDLTHSSESGKNLVLLS